MALQLEKHLVLNHFFLDLLGFENFEELRKLLKDVKEGYDNEGRSYFVNTLIGIENKKLTEEELLRYDNAIRKYVEKLRKNRNLPNFNLKYFQYLAVLFTEIFLDRYFNHRLEFLIELNNFLNEFNEKNNTQIGEFKEEELKKLAYWIATGGGKTVIMHINYCQILKYFNKWDRIFLITPNEGLSEQHYRELKKSGIPCKLYRGNDSDLNTQSGEILVIDIHKLKLEKKGEGITVDVNWFKGKNLVFIDEGHKGQRTEEQTWKKVRETLAENGFIFEYSATFGQIIEFDARGKPKRESQDLYNEYTKAIIFSYPYKYFYFDGYGKDFQVLNIGKGEFSEKQEELLLTAGLLTYYQQLFLYEQNREEFKEYNIEKPLWIFVGSSVSGKKVITDVEKVVKFLKEVLSNKNRLEGNVKEILEGKHEFLKEFLGNLKVLEEGILNKTFKGNLTELVNDIYERIFHGFGSLELYKIKNAEGEIGLKVKTSQTYFGVINIGDVRSFEKKVSQTLEISFKEDHFEDSLFFKINENNSPINLLIGSKKFIEGWDSWRVSSICLLNIGRKEGAQVIQLFGRGVRLKGKNYSLKREENADRKLRVLQTLYIFGINANYMDRFLDVITKEDVNYETFEIEIRYNEKCKWNNKLYVLKTPDDFDFYKQPLQLEYDEKIAKKVKLNLAPKVVIRKGLEDKTTIAEKDSVYISKDDLRFLDWNEITDELENHKQIKEMFNLQFDTQSVKEVFEKLLEEKKYKLFLTETENLTVEGNKVKPKTFDGFKEIEEIAFMLLKKYIDEFYKEAKKKAVYKNLIAEPIEVEKDKNLFPFNGEIVVQIPKEDSKNIEKIKGWISKLKCGNIPSEWKDFNFEKTFLVHFDKHLYTPLAIFDGKHFEEIKTIPVRLNEGETKFVRDLKEFLTQKESEYGEFEIYLLRNLAKRGIGFLVNESGFYPDFIMWIVSNKQNIQHIVFIDPKGLRNEGIYSPKVEFCTKDIKEIEAIVNKYLENKCENVKLKLDAFIVSVSPYEEVKEWNKRKDNEEFSKEELEERNILFMENNYIQKLLAKVLSKTS